MQKWIYISNIRGKGAASIFCFNLRCTYSAFKTSTSECYTNFVCRPREDTVYFNRPYSAELSSSWPCIHYSSALYWETPPRQWWTIGLQCLTCTFHPWPLVNSILTPITGRPPANWSPLNYNCTIASRTFQLRANQFYIGGPVPRASWSVLWVNSSLIEVQRPSVHSSLYSSKWR